MDSVDILRPRDTELDKADSSTAAYFEQRPVDLVPLATNLPDQHPKDTEPKKADLYTVAGIEQRSVMTSCKAASSLCCPDTTSSGIKPADGRELPVDSISVGSVEQQSFHDSNSVDMGMNSLYSPQTDTFCRKIRDAKLAKTTMLTSEHLDQMNTENIDGLDQLLDDTENIFANPSASSRLRETNLLPMIGKT